MDVAVKNSDQRTEWTGDLTPFRLRCRTGGSCLCRKSRASQISRTCGNDRYSASESSLSSKSHHGQHWSCRIPAQEINNIPVSKTRKQKTWQIVIVMNQPVKLDDTRVTQALPHLELGGETLYAQVRGLIRARTSALRTKVRTE